MQNIGGLCGIFIGLSILWMLKVVLFTSIGQIVVSDLTFSEIAREIHAMCGPIIDRHMHFISVGEFLFALSAIVSLYVYEGPNLRLFVCMFLSGLCVLCSGFLIRALGPLVSAKRLQVVFVAGEVINLVGIVGIVATVCIIDIGARPRSKLFFILAVLLGSLAFEIGLFSVKVGLTFLPAQLMMCTSFPAALAAGTLFWTDRNMPMSKNSEENSQLIEKVDPNDT